MVAKEEAELYIGRAAIICAKNDGGKLVEKGQNWQRYRMRVNVVGEGGRGIKDIPGCISPFCCSDMDSNFYLISQA